MKPNTMSDRMMTYLDDPKWPSILKTLIRRKLRGEPLPIYNNTWTFSS